MTNKSFESILKCVTQEIHSFYDCKKSNEPIDELIKTIADENEILVDSHDFKMLSGISKIALDNLGDKEKINTEAKQYFEKEKLKREKIGQDIADSEILKEINVRMCLLTAVALNEFNKNMKEYKVLLLNIITKRCNYIKSRGNIKIYDVLPIENRTDSFSSWKFDPLAGHMKVYLEPIGEFFPQKWRLDETTKIGKFKLEDKLPEDIQMNLNINTPFDKFLDHTLEANTSDIINFLSQLHISNIKGLKELSAEGWRLVENRIPAHVNKLRTEIDKLRADTLGPGTNEDKRSVSELLNDWNKVKRLLYYEYKSEKNPNPIVKKTFKDFSYIDPDAFDLGIQELKSDKTFDMGTKIDEIRDKLEVYTLPQSDEDQEKLRKKSHGMLFYGPPGTGKTEITKRVIKKVGLTEVCIPLSSAELNKSKVGETEQLLKDIFERATYIPHLLCCIAIDEVDALTPKRDDKIGHKIDALTLLLSLIGGIKDVPNVYVIASTNRLNKIDEAIARRLQDKIYIGKLSNTQRVDLLKLIENNKITGLNDHVKIKLTDNLQKLLAKLTINFSAAALESLRSRILNYFDKNKNRKDINTLEESKLYELAIKVAYDYQIKLGRYIIPELLRDSFQNNNSNVNKLSNAIFKEGKKGETLPCEDFTGRVLVDLSQSVATIQFELKNQNTLKEIKLDIKFANEFIPLLLDFSIKFNIDNIQLLNTDTLLSASANDENAISELVNEAFEEFEKYDRSLICFDVDNLVGNIETSSDSNSKSYSIQNQRLWQTILHASKKSFNFGKWCFIISGSSFLIEQFKSKTKFPLSKDERKKEDEEEAECRTIRKCLNCDLLYFESDNRLDSCAYHNDKLVKNDEHRYPISKAELFNLDDDSVTPEEKHAYFKMYYFTCCLRPYMESKDMGCKRNFHSNAHKHKDNCDYDCLKKD